MPWHGHHATLPSETFLEAAWGLVEGSWVALEGPWTALGKVFGGSWEALDGFQEASWAKDSNSYNFQRLTKIRNFGGPFWRRFNIKNCIF